MSVVKNAKNSKGKLKAEKQPSSDEEEVLEEIAPEKEDEENEDSEEEEEDKKDPKEIIKKMMVPIEHHSSDYVSSEANSTSTDDAIQIRNQPQQRREANQSDSGRRNDSMPLPGSMNAPNVRVEFPPSGSQSSASTPRQPSNLVVLRNPPVEDVTVEKFSSNHRFNCFAIFAGLVLITISISIFITLSISAFRPKTAKIITKIIAQLDDPFDDKKVITIDNNEILTQLKKISYINIEGNKVSLKKRPPTLQNMILEFSIKYPLLTYQISFWILVLLIWLFILFNKLRARYHLQTAINIINRQPGHQIFIDDLRREMQASGICTFGMWRFLCNLLDNQPAVQLNSLPYTSPFYSITPFTPH